MSKNKNYFPNDLTELSFCLYIIQTSSDWLFCRSHRYRLDQVLAHAEKDVLRETHRHKRRKEIHELTEKSKEKKVEERRQERQLGMMVNDVSNRLKEKNKEDLAAMKRDLVNEIKMNFLDYKLQHFQSMQF